MENVKKQKVWDAPLNSKNYRYYALVKYIGSEKTWSCFFKVLKTLDKLKKYISLIDFKLSDKSLFVIFENIFQSFNELSYCFGNEAITRLVFYNIREEYFSNVKTLLEYKDLLYNHNIPEANIVNIPFNTELVDKLSNFKNNLM